MKVVPAPITITTIENDIASCNVCYARNYDADDAIGSRVDTLYRLRIGNQGVTLCDACRRRVAAVLLENI
jgi:hypothetical protein